MADYLILERLRKHHAETYYHSLRVSQLCFQVAQMIGMDHDQSISALRSGLLHDVGKMNIPDHILSKKGKLMESEYQFIQKHVEFGVQILKDNGYEQNIISAIEGHHEREDGCGYPKQIIPEDALSKIVAVCDVYDAMTEKRSYKESLPKEFVLEQMEIGKIGAFYLQYVEALRYTVLSVSKASSE
ncbi:MULTISPECIES: HD-GYP domain-containing protein [unclassified Paenibacillus]|uniref:HD-GYP domain-containing protein n=1 Tax=unclassified Paenibacillus TaxID=185978 RepID=UPI002785F60B|nr:MULTISPECIES: HD domain-containing phosphohydrolase [unclassified Paenibacillus]MDQ0896204.1 putative nucleotidyltransferase with HDIG domain [Paenibacillus sp. V4I7]MDQ0913980.1 putative nucleotidyltransferase with HDIG domain [Paenibacillus sp. V4I5]